MKFRLLSLPFFTASIGLIFLISSCIPGQSPEVIPKTAAPVTPINPPTLINIPTQTATSTPTSTPTVTLSPALSRTSYISPNGSDTNGGDSLLSPWKTFALAIPNLQPGDTLIVMNGTYENKTTGLPNIDCSNSEMAHNGTSSLPITIKAQDERQALLKSDGTTAAFYMTYCSYWNIVGLSGSSTDLSSANGGNSNSIFQIGYSTDLVLKRLLSAYTNRYFNNHTYEIAYSSRILVEESEAYYFHRHGFSFYQSKNITARRNYANPREYADLPGGHESLNPTGGDDAYSLYYTSDSIIENSIVQGNSQGFKIHGGPNFDGTPGGQNNKVLGSIFFGGPTADYGGKIETRMIDNVIWATKNNVLINVLFYTNSSPGIFLESTVNATLENVTFYDMGADGIQVKEGDDSNPWCPHIPEGCGFTLLNSIVYNSAKYNISVRDNIEWAIDYSNISTSGFGDFRAYSEAIDDASDHVQHSLSVAPTKMDPKNGFTPVYIPEGSNMKGVGLNGADIGATILYRYENGTLTQDPLWDPGTGAFPCGGILSGINDRVGSSCFDIHTQLNINPQTLPLNYGNITGTASNTNK